MRRWGSSVQPARPMTRSTSSANSAAGIAPSRISRVLASASPRLMNWPNPPAPMKAESVAMPTLITAAVRTPAIITGRASGSRTIHSRCQAVMPMPWAASLTSAGTPSSPAIVLRTIGNSAYNVSAMIAGSAPMRCNSAKSNVSIARLGTVCRISAPARIVAHSFGPRAAKIPAGMPINIARPVAVPVSTRCCVRRSQSSGSRSATNVVQGSPFIRTRPEMRPIGGPVCRTSRGRTAWRASRAPRPACPVAGAAPRAARQCDRRA